MTNTMEHPPLSDQVIANIRERFADECKRLLEGMSKCVRCTCGKDPRLDAEHEPECPVAAWREAAHAVWMWGQPK